MTFGHTELPTESLRDPAQAATAFGAGGPMRHGTTGATRDALEAFIGARYARAFGARVDHFCSNLVGLQRDDGAWRAAVGYTPAADAPLYLEHYLEHPIEVTIAAASGGSVARARVVEVGNLAATTPGAARELIHAMGKYLRGQGFAWVAFTATRELRNTFARLGYAPLSLARADPAHLADGGAAWGRYYAHDPIVMAGRLAPSAVGRSR